MGTYNSCYDGLIGLKLKKHTNDYLIGIIGFYLPPDNYIYGQDAENFFNAASVLWQDLSYCELLIGGGDFNSRTKEILDIIPEVDGNLIPKRYNPDKIKKYS